MYAGQNGAKRLPGRSAEGEMVAARRRCVFPEQQDCVARRLRHLLGAMELPAAEHGNEQLRPDRLHGEHPDPAKPVHPQASRSTTHFQMAWCSRRGVRWVLLTGRGHEHPLRRSEQGRAARPAVLCGSAARAFGRHVVDAVLIGSRGEISGTADWPMRPSTSINSIPSTCRSARGSETRCPTRSSGSRWAAGPLSTQATLSRGQLLRPYPEFNDVFALQKHRREKPLQRRGLRASEARDKWVGRAFQLHLQPSVGQSVRGDEQLFAGCGRHRAPTLAAPSTTTISMRNTAAASWTCRTGWCSRR